MRKITRFLFGFFATLFAVVSASACVGILWLLSGSFESSGFSPIMETAFSYAIPGAQVRIASSVLAWNHKKQILSLTCDGIDMLDPSGVRLASFPSIHLRTNVWSLLRGRVLPLEMGSDEARFWFTRTASGGLTLGAPETGEADFSGTDPTFLLAKMADELAQEGLKHTINIKNATLFIKDGVSGVQASVRVPEISLFHEAKGAQGKARIEIEGQERPLYAQASYAFDPEKSVHRIGLSFQDVRPSALARPDGPLATLKDIGVPLSGTLILAVDRALRIVDAAISLRSGEGILGHPALWDAPLTVKKGVLEGGYDKNANLWVLRRAEVDFEKARLLVTAEAKAPVRKNEAWLRVRQDQAYRARITLENLAMNDFSTVWPKTALVNPRIWIAEHLSAGVFTKGEITLSGQVDWDDFTQSTLEKAQGILEAKGADVLYLDGMPAINGVDAKARFDLAKMDIDISGGKCGEIVLHPFTIRMEGLDKETQTIVIPAKLSGPTRAILERIKGPPLGYAEQLGIEPKDIGGRLEGTLTLRFPLLMDLLLKDVRIEAKAKLRSFSSLNLVPNFPLSGGALALSLTNDGFTLDGPLSVRKVPLTLSWKTAFGARKNAHDPLHQARLVGAVDGDAWERSALLEGKAHVEGVTPLTVSYVQTENGFFTLEAEANLLQADVRVGVLNWDKSKGAHGRFSFTLDATKEDAFLNVRKISLSGVDANVAGSATMAKETGEFTALHLSPFVVGRSDAKIDITSGPNGAMRTVVRGKTLDVAKKEGQKKQEDEAAIKHGAETYDLKVGKLLTSAQGFMEGVTLLASRSGQGWEEISFQGKAQGEIPVSLMLVKQGQTKKLSAETEDFGLALKGLGLTDGVSGGRLTVSGANAPNEPDVLRGTFKVNAFQVADAPFLARLFSAVSPFGFADLVTGKSSFDRMKGSFVLRDTMLQIEDLRAPGSVAGINLAGTVDLCSGNANLSGTVVPFSFMNSIIGAIPLIGDVITGGAGQGVIAAAFTVKGPLSATDISVNPVSLLTPGFLRNLFFGVDTGDGS